jgi:hypothetical protein
LAVDNDSAANLVRLAKDGVTTFDTLLALLELIGVCLGDRANCGAEGDRDDGDLKQVGHHVGGFLMFVIKGMFD